MTWSSATLGEVAERDGGLIQTGPFGSQLHQSDYVPDGIPVIMPKDIIDGRINSATVARVSEETANRLRRHQVRPRTIVLPRRGEITKRAFVRDDQAGWLCGTGCLQIALEGKHLVPEFLYYYMQQESISRWLEQHAVGTTMLNLSAEIVTELPLKYPVLSAQQRIAEILTAYDDLIENHLRRTVLLDEAMRQLYREWFVGLRFPGHEHTRITNGVPNGWQRRTLESCAIFRSGGTPNKARTEYWEGEIPWVSSGEMSETRIYDTPLHVSAEGAEEGSRLISPNTILIVVRGMSLAKEFRIATVAREMAFNQDLKALESTDGVDSLFLFHSLLDQRNGIRELATEASHGTKKLDTAVLERLPILVAEPRLQRLFRDTVALSLAQRDNLYHQNTRLRAARDLLLPRLMSGEIAV